MKKLVTLLTLFLLALVSTTYLYYTHWRSEQQLSAPLPYMPPSTALVYEVANFHQQWEQFQKTAMGQELSPLPPLAAIQQVIDWLKQEILQDIRDLNKVPLILSIHQPDKGPLDCLLYFNTHDRATQKLLAAIMGKIKQDKTYHTTSRRYANRRITSWSKEGTTQQLSYIKRNQYIIASFSPRLIEEVAHTVSKPEPSFLSLNKSENAQGSLYINLAQLPRLVHTLVKPTQAHRLSNALVTLAQASHLQLKLTPHHLLLSGTVTAPASNPQYLPHTMDGQTPGAIQLASYLPQQATVLQHVTFSDAAQLLAAWQQYRAKTNTPPQDSDALLQATLAPLLQGEISHCTLSDQQGQLVFMQATDPQAFIKVLKSAKALTPVTLSKLPTQTYRLQPHCLQHGLPGQLFPTFQAAYLTQIGDYLVLASRREALQTWYTQYQQGKTWSKIPTKNAWLASTLDQAHLTWFVDLPQVWQSLIQSLQSPWQQRLKNQKAPPIDASLQLLSDPQNGCYISILIKHQEENSSAKNLLQPPKVPKKVPPPQVKTPPTPAFFQAEAPLIHAPWLVKSHRGKGPYVLLQDVQHQLYLLDPTGKLLWKKTLEGPITTEVFEIDFYKNNKTQYLFATDQKLYLLDYYGRRVGPYPQPLPQPAQLQVVDYNRDKTYRFLLATKQGAIYLKDKYYKPLAGWNPRALGHAFAAAPFHARLKARDRFLALQTNGTLYALTRRGQTYPGFPVDLKATTHHPLLVHQAGAALTVLTDEGKYIRINLAGQIQETVQLNRTAHTRRFMLCPNQAGGASYAIVRQDDTQIAVIDAAMKPLFKVPYAKKQLLVQYYGFEKGKQFYVFTDPEAQLSYLYDHTGQQLTPPWPSGHAVSIILDKHQLKLYSCVGTQCISHVLNNAGQ